MESVTIALMAALGGFSVVLGVAATTIARWAVEVARFRNKHVDRLEVAVGGNRYVIHLDRIESGDTREVDHAIKAVKEASNLHIVA